MPVAERLYLWMRTPDAGLSIEITGLEPDDDAPILELHQRNEGEDKKCEFCFSCIAPW